MNKRSNSIRRGESAQAVVDARVSSKEQEREGYESFYERKVAVWGRFLDDFRTALLNSNQGAPTGRKRH